MSILLRNAKYRYYRNLASVDRWELPRMQPPVTRDLSTKKPQMRNGSNPELKPLTIYESPISRPMSILKCMSLAGSFGSCLSTAGFYLLQNTAMLSGIDIDFTALILASVASVSSTTVITFLFRPFVTRIDYNPSTSSNGSATQSSKKPSIDEHGMPKFRDIMNQSARAGSTSPSGSVQPEFIDTLTELTFYTISFTGLSSKSLRLRIAHLQPSTSKLGTWEMRPRFKDQIRGRNGGKLGHPSFIVAWKMSEEGTHRNILARVDSIIRTQK